MRRIFFRSWLTLLLGVFFQFEFQDVVLAEALDHAVWASAMLDARAQCLEGTDAKTLVRELEQAFPVRMDWLAQDLDGAPERWFAERNASGLEIALIGGALGHDAGTLIRYAEACEKRRAARLEIVLAKTPRIVFTKHYNLGGSHYAYTEGQSDAQRERHFVPGSALCLLEMDGLHGTVRPLLEDKNGVIRDPDVSYDGERILFAWKKSDREDDYHLYEMEAATGEVRQLTDGLGFADYEGAYLPGGDIVFNSTRCVQTVDCWWTEVSNLYTCASDGRFLRRLTFDQVHTNYPAVLDDGRVVYTRWDYNDRGQIYPQPLFQMNPDGTGQTEFYGNNSWFPTTILHARGIPGSQQLVAIASGHHTAQNGKLILIDPRRGRQENEGIQLIAPVRDTPAVHVDQYGQKGIQFQHPYPLSETEFLVACAPRGGARQNDKTFGAHFGIYWVDVDGHRELLAYDSNISCSQPVPLRARKEPHARPSTVDFRKDTGAYYVQDVYTGPGLEGIPRGTIKRLRVVALEFRAAGIGDNRNRGAAGGALVSTPPAIDNGAWDVKVVLGDAKVHRDGSAFFEVPARTPVYFQALDEKGYAVQTMRSWSTLQPGETFSCVGCHEKKSDAPPAREMTRALQAGAQTLTPFYGPARGFSFAKEVQPILDKHCISCHDGDTGNAGGRATFSLLGRGQADKQAKRRWSESYLWLTQNGQSGDFVNWIDIQSAPAMLPPYAAGAAKSGLMGLLENGHAETKLSREEREKIACWIDLLVPFCGDYTEANAWSEAEQKKYAHFLDKRRTMEAAERKNIEALVAARERLR